VSFLYALTAVVASGQTFACTPVAVYDGDGAILAAAPVLIHTSLRCKHSALRRFPTCYLCNLLMVALSIANGGGQ
jgi:hypothetical protein